MILYEKNETDFSGYGLGYLLPASCVWTGVANANNEIEFTHPIDVHGLWRNVTEGRIVKVKVPVRTLPNIANGEEQGFVQLAYIKAGMSDADRTIYRKATGNKKVTVLSRFMEVGPGEADDQLQEIYVLGGTAEDERLKVSALVDRYKTKRGVSIFTRENFTGYMNASALDVQPTHISTGGDIENVLPAWTVKSQLFRIVSVEKNDKTGLNVYARHISYDLAANAILGAGNNEEQLSCWAALQSISEKCTEAHDFELDSNISGLAGGCYWRRGYALDAIMNEETGICGIFGGDLVRDDFVMYVMGDAGKNRGVKIEYGKNMLGVSCKLDTSNVITAVVPVGQDYKGNDLMLVPGTYTLPDATEVEIGSNLCVYGDNFDAFAEPHTYILELGEDCKATGKKASQVLNCRVRMIERALTYIEENGADAEMTLDVTHIDLGSTEEYAQFAQLERLFLHDTVEVVHTGLGIEFETRVAKMQWDCLTERVISTELGSYKRDLGEIPIMLTQIPRRGLVTKVNMSDVHLTGESTANLGSATFSRAAGILVAQTVEDADAPTGERAVTYWQANSQQAGFYNAADDSMIAGLGVDTDGKGYFAANRLRDPLNPNNGYVNLKAIDIGYGTGYEMHFMSPDFAGADINNPVPVGFVPGLQFSVINLPGSVNGLTLENSFIASIFTAGLLHLPRVQLHEVTTQNNDNIPVALGSESTFDVSTSFYVMLDAANWSGNSYSYGFDYPCVKCDCTMLCTPAPEHLSSGVHLSGFTRHYELLETEPTEYDYYTGTWVSAFYPWEYYKSVGGEYVLGEDGDVWATNTWYDGTYAQTLEFACSGAAPSTNVKMNLVAISNNDIGDIGDA